MVAHSSPDGRTRGAGLIGFVDGVLIVAKWFSMRSCAWIRLYFVLYWCFLVPCGFLLHFAVL